MTMINRTQALVVAFFAGVVVATIAIRVMAPDVFQRVLEPPTDDARLEIAFFAGTATVIVLITVGAVRRWRWMFWLTMAILLSGVLRVPVAILQVAGVVSADAPNWYLVLQGGIGLVQAAIGAAMVVGYRRAGVWGAF
ncbi:MAG TPA: hypothetical protein VF069_18620 [Streptosporangiaceae bacterium]